MSNTDNKHIIEALLGKGIKAYRESDTRIAIVIPEDGKVKRAYLNTDSETFGRRNKGRDDRQITGDLGTAGQTLMNYLVKNVEIAEELEAATPRKGNAVTADVAFEDVMKAF